MGGGLLTISQNHTLNFLKVMVLLELRNNLMKRNECLIQRSTRQTITIRNLEVQSSDHVVNNSPDTQHLFLKFLTFDITSED